MRQLVFTFILVAGSVGGVYALATENEAPRSALALPVYQAGKNLDHAMRGNPEDVIRRVNELLPPVDETPLRSKEPPVSVDEFR